jgi:hypothetical protein
VRICQLTQGLPLGTELAASWVRLTPCSDIVREMERGLELLTTDTTNVPERQRSLRVAFDYSWTLLSEKEREVFKNLSVFRGGFRREAASKVAGATIPTLASLVDKSLLKVLPNGRYTLQATVFEKKAVRTLLDELVTQLSVQQLLMVETKIKQRFLEQRFFEVYVTTMLATVFAQQSVTA